MRLFNYRSQMTLKCGKNKKVAHEAQSQQFVTYHIKRNWFPLVHLKITTQSGWYTVCAIFKSRKIFYFLVTIKVSPRRLWFLRAVSINIINVNESDPRSNEHYLGSSENKALKNFRPVQDLNLFSLLSFSLLLKKCSLLWGSLSFTSLSAVQKDDFHIFTAV